jgi:hypothetical protein
MPISYRKTSGQRVSGILFFTFFILAFCPLWSAAQVKLQGTVLDSLSGTPLNLGSVRLIELPDTTGPTTMTDRNGMFSFARVRKGNYRKYPVTRHQVEDPGKSNGGSDRILPAEPH